LPALPAKAQSEDCSTEPSLDGDDLLGFNPAPTPMSDDFAMTGSACVDFSATFFPAVCAANVGYDNVVCLMGATYTIAPLMTGDTCAAIPTADQTSV